MQATRGPAAAGKSLSPRDLKHPHRQALDRSVITLVAGSLLAGGATLQAQEAPPVSSGAGGLSASAPGSPVPNSVLTTYPNEVSATADFLYGQGNVTLPLGYALAKSLPGNSLRPQVMTVNRSTEYYGGTVSYAYNRSWCLDFSYANGSSSGAQNVTINNTFLGNVSPGHFNANLDYRANQYQLYLRHNFHDWLAGTPFQAYVRGGVDLVDATMTVNDNSPSPLYQQRDETTDVTGNLGVGLTFSLYHTPRFQLSLQGEGDGSWGGRCQDSTETLPLDYNLGPTHAHINNELYGCFGRGTLHADWRVGQSERWCLTGDVGLQARYTIVTFPDGGGSPAEYLWGPCVQIGVRFVF